MRQRSISLSIAAMAVSLAVLSWSASLGQTPPPWKPFVACTVVDADGKSVPAILTPGPMPGTWVAIVGGSRVWHMTPFSAPLPPNPPPPTPPPSPPTPPTPTHEAQRLALAAAEKLPGEGRREDARKLAAVYRTLADQIPHAIDSIDKLITANRYAREIALGPQRGKVWEPWVKEMGLWLDAQRAAGTIKTVEDCKPVWRAIADGLEAVN